MKKLVSVLLCMAIDRVPAGRLRKQRKRNRPDRLDRRGATKSHSLPWTPLTSTGSP